MAPWQKPWKPGERRLPENVASKKPYRAGNSVYLSVTQTAKSYGDNRWATYKQIKDMGSQVRKGEKATHVLFYKFDDERKEQQPGAVDKPATSPDGPAEHERTRPPMVRCYAVFNVEQADGLKLERRDEDRDNEPEWKAHQTAERVIQESGIPVRHERGDRAYYNLQTDRVTLPEREQSATANGHYQTALHELGRATGHPARMDRDALRAGAGKFGSVEYAREELRAEMSAMITGERVGVGHDPGRGAAYVEGWLKALDKDPKEIYKAVADAQKISDYLMRPIREREQATEQEDAHLAEKYSAARRRRGPRRRSPSGSQASAGRRSPCLTGWICFERIPRRPSRQAQTRRRMRGRTRARRKGAHRARTATTPPATTGFATSGPAIVGNTRRATAHAAPAPCGPARPSPTWGSIEPCPTRICPNKFLRPPIHHPAARHADEARRAD